MTFQFPFVSRERLNEVKAEAKAEQERLRAELAEWRHKYEKVSNFLIWRTGGVAPDESLLPEAYQRKRVATPANAAGPAKVATKSDRATRHNPQQARAKIADFEASRQNEFERALGFPMPEREAQAEVAARLDNEVTLAASGD